MGNLIFLPDTWNHFGRRETSFIWPDTWNHFFDRTLKPLFFDRILETILQEAEEDCEVSPVWQQLHQWRHGALAAWEEGMLPWTMSWKRHSGLKLLELHFIWVARPSNFSSKVTFSDTIRPACLPDDPTETYGYKVGTYTVQSLWLIARLNLFSFGFLPLGKYKRHSRAICHSLYGFSIKAHQWKSTIWMSQPYILVCSVFTIFSLQSGIITGWGYTEVTKILKPRPLTSDVLREAEIYILPQANIVRYNQQIYKYTSCHWQI